MSRVGYCAWIYSTTGGQVCRTGIRATRAEAVAEAARMIISPGEQAGDVIEVEIDEDGEIHWPGVEP